MKARSYTKTGPGRQHRFNSDTPREANGDITFGDKFAKATANNTLTLQHRGIMQNPLTKAWSLHK